MSTKSRLQIFYNIIRHYPDLKYALLEAQTYNEEHFGFPPIYYKIMETDEARVNAFVNTFNHYNQLKDSVVCEVGVGTLALTKHFLPYVKKAYLIESNPDIVDFIHTELKKNHWDKKVEFIHADAQKVTLPEPVDYIIGEMMSIFCANELQVQVFKHMRQFLKPEGKLIPENIINLVQLCQANFEENHQHYPLMFTRHFPQLYSSQETVNTINLYQESELAISRKTKLKIRLSGEVNAVFLNSWISMMEGINFTGTDSLMPPTVVKLKHPINVKKGQTVELKTNFTYGSSLDEATFSASILD